MSNREYRLSRLLNACQKQSPSNQWRKELKRWTQMKLAQFKGERDVIKGLNAVDWEAYIQQHAAHRHSWYDYLSEEASLSDFANFFLENQGVPPFVELVQRTLSCQLTERGKSAILENISDEEKPTPHHQLMQRLMAALRPHFSGKPVTEQLMERQLTTFSGYWLDPWQLTGSLFATEAMGSHRMKKMWEGLKRLGLSKHDLEYATIHITCDEHHAAQWYQSVIKTSLEKKPQLVERLVDGIILSLIGDKLYLDYRRGQSTFGT